MRAMVPRRLLADGDGRGLEQGEAISPIVVTDWHRRNGDRR